MSEQEHLPCILFTGDASAPAEIAALDAGADAFVHKGTHEAVLRARLEVLVRRASVPSYGPAGGRTVLLVHEDPQQAAPLVALLERSGLIVDTVAHACVVERLESQHVDVLIIDRFANGRTLVPWLRSVALGRMLPIVVLTEPHEPDALVESLDAGADDCVDRGRAPEVVFAHIRALLRRRGGVSDHRTADATRDAAPLNTRVQAAAPDVRPAAATPAGRVLPRPERGVR